MDDIREELFPLEMTLVNAKRQKPATERCIRDLGCQLAGIHRQGIKSSQVKKRWELRMLTRNGGHRRVAEEWRLNRNSQLTLLAPALINK